MSVPLVRTTGGGDGCRRHAPSRSASAEPERNEFGAFAGFHSRENGALAILLRGGQRIAHVRRRGNLLARDLQDDVACLEALLRADTIGINFRDDDSLATAPGHFACGC